MDGFTRRKTNLITGKNRYFNTFETWSDNDRTLVLCKRKAYKAGFSFTDTPEEYYGIWGAGNGGYAKEGEQRKIYHDQTRNFISNLTIVKEVVFTKNNYKEVGEKLSKELGLKSLTCSVFK